VTPTAVADRAGIARTSVYDYFPSREDLLVQVALDAFEEWDRDLAAALQDVEHGLPQLLCYLDATMAMAADGRHNLAATLRFTDLSPQRAEEVAALHNALQEPLLTILGEVGVVDPADAAPYVQALIGVGLRRVSGGEDPHAVASQIHRIAVSGILPADPTAAP